MNQRKKQLIFYSLCVSVIFIVSATAFIIYSTNMNQTFTQIERENLNAYAKSQTQEVIATLNNVEATVKVVANALSVDVDSLTPEQIRMIIDVASEENDSFFMNYYPLSKMPLDKMSEEDKKMVARVIDGEFVISDVEYNEAFDENKEYFGVAAPVYKGSEVVGLVRALVSSEHLYKTNQTGFLRDSVQSRIIYSNGQLVSGLMSFDENVFDHMKRADKEVVKQITNDLKKGVSSVKSLNINGKFMCISYFALPYNNWYIINDVDHNALSIYSNNLRSLTLLLVLAIASAAILVGTLFIYLIKRSEKKLRMESERFSLLVNFTDTILCKYIFADDVLLFTPNTLNTLDIDDITIHHFGQNNVVENLCHPEDAKKVRNIIYGSKAEQEIQTFDVRVKTKNHQYAWYIAQVEFEYKRNKPVSAIAKLTDNSKAKQEYDRLKERADYDGLTGLYRYQVVKEKIIEHLQQYATGILGICDSDKFKHINDTYGHAVGDHCLMMLAEVVKDKIGIHNLTGRYGGDEFIFFIKEAKDIEEIDELMKQLLNSIHDIVIEEYPDIHLSCCIGLACMRKGKDYKTLFKESDESLYKAKKQGAGTYVIKK